MSILSTSIAKADLPVVDPISSIDDYFLKNKNSKIFPFSKSQSGTTGFTFLPSDPRFSWVVKWQGRPLSEVEYVCTQFYGRTFSHLSIPRLIYTNSDRFIKNCHAFFKRQPATFPENYVPLFLGRLNGNNLKQFCENESLFTLGLDEIRQLFTLFGEVSGYDFLIANYDRFLPINFNNKTEQQPNLNPGNILIELNNPAQSIAHKVSSTLNKLHLIDNAPYAASFFALKEIREEENSNDEFLSLNLFDDDQVNTNLNDSPESSNFLESAASKYREQCHQNYKEFIEMPPAKIQDLAQSIADNIYTGLKKEYPNKEKLLSDIFKSDKSMQYIRGSLSEGLKTAQTNLKKIDLIIIKQLKDECKDYTPAAHIMLDFIEKNLSSQKNEFESRIDLKEEKI